MMTQMSDLLASLVEFKDTLNHIKIKDLIDTYFQTKNPSDRDFIMSLIDYTLGFRQKEVMNSEVKAKPFKGKTDPNFKQLNIIAGIDGSGKTTFYHTVKDLFQGSHFIEKKRHALYKACERYFNLKRSLTIEVKLTADDTDLLPIIKLAQKFGYEVYVYVIIVDPVDLIQNRLAEKYGKSPFTGHKLASFQFYSGSIINELLNETDRFMVIDNTDLFQIAHINWPSDQFRTDDRSNPIYNF